jgi:hypothetical protein
MLHGEYEKFLRLLLWYVKCITVDCLMFEKDSDPLPREYENRTVLTFFDARNFARSGARDGIFKLLRSTEIDAASICSLAGRYNNPFPTRFLAPIVCSKIPAQ